MNNPLKKDNKKWARVFLPTFIVFSLLATGWLGCQAFYGCRIGKTIYASNREATQGLSGITWLVMSDLVRLTNYMERQVKQGLVNSSNIEKLDFSERDSLSYGDDPTWEVFNPASPFHPAEYEQYLISKAALENIVTDKKTKALVNLRSTEINDRVILGLYLVIPNVKDSECISFFGSLRGYERNPIKKLSHTLEIAPDNHTIIHDEFSLPGVGGCVNSANQGTTLLLRFYSLTKNAGK